MRPAKPDALRAGFSLIEATAAVALTTTIVMALSSVAGQWLPNWRRGLVDLQRADLLGVGLERVVEDVSAAEYVTPSSDMQAPLFEGDSSTVEFVRSAIGPNAYPHLEVVRLAETRDDRGAALTRRRAPFAPIAPGPSAHFDFGDGVALIRAPFRVSFAYAGPDRVWVDRWKGRKSLPDAVRITVRDASNRVLAASTAISMKVNAQGVPKLEAKANAASEPVAPATSTPQESAPEPQQ